MGTIDKVTKDNNAESEPLYDYHKVYPKKVGGFFRRLKWYAVAILLGLYYAAPWLRWDRGPGAPDQAILIDLPGRRAYFFFIEIWPQEVYYLTGLLILGAVGLFFVTALLGRIWCGYACPQTVWTDLFLWVERQFEGDRNERMRLDKQPWSVKKFGRKLGKHIAWIFISAATGGAWVMYFADAPTVVPDIFTGDAGSGIYTFMAIFTGTTYLLAGWAREQVCIYMCPWPRFQAAMFDEHSKIVTYEAWRGEPRGYAKKGEAFQNRGHCVDCKQCVLVCPTGIDIRDGSQLACIGCALCVDACDNIMDKMNLPRGLIAWDSLKNVDHRAKGEEPHTKFLRARTVIYVGVLAVVGAVMLYSLLNRSTTEINVLHERSPLYVPLSDGSVRNGYTFKILNMVRETRTYVLQAEGIEGVKFSVVGQESQGEERVVLPVNPDSIGVYQVYVTAEPKNLNGKSTDLTFVLTEQSTGAVKTHDTLFAGPTR